MHVPVPRSTTVALLAMALIVCAGGAAVASQPAKTVLLISWGPEEFPSNTIISAAVAQVLTTDPTTPVDYYAEYLESDRFPPGQAEPALRDYIRQKFRGRHIDLVIAYTDPAREFVMTHRHELFPDAPVVFGGLEVPPGTSRTADGGFTGILVGVAYRQTLEMALRLHPGTRRLFVIARGRPENLASLRAALDDTTKSLDVTYLSPPTLDELLRAVRAIPRGSLILYVYYAFDSQSRPMYSDAVERVVANAAPVPMYGTSDLFVGTGVVGGVVRSTADTGSQLAHTALAILNGTPASAIPIEHAPLVPILDWRQLTRWSIDESRLPPDADIRFRVPSVWEAYRRYVVWLTVALAAQLLLIAALLAQSGRRRAAEAVVRQREAALRKSFERIRQLAGKLITAQETTRANIARDLHDDVCQDLVGISMAVSSLTQNAAITDPGARAALTKVHEWTVGTAEGVRRLSHDLHPATLRLLGLAAALKSYCLEVEKRYGVQVTCEPAYEPARLDADLALCLFRIAQEALRNAAVHGEAQHLRVALDLVDDHLQLTIADDGVGFDVDAVLRDAGGLGLISMQERARLVGGDVHFTAAPGHGATVQVRVAMAPRVTITTPGQPPARLRMRRPHPARRRLAELA